jgi:uncharacterized membrane protein
MNAAAVPEPAPDVRANPHLHEPRLVTSAAHRGSGLLNRVAVWVSAFVGSMWVFVAVTTFIVAWLFAGNVVGFDRTPWPLLLTIINLPQLSVMISLQVSANIAQRTSDARAVADHDTLIALSEMNKRQLELINRLLREGGTEERV